MSDTVPDTPSPCIAVCTLDPESGLCRGCYRTLEEIGAWMLMAPERRREVMALVAERRLEHDAEAAEARREDARRERRAGRRRVSRQNR